MSLVQTLSVLWRECSEEVGSVYGWSIDIGSSWGGKGVREGESIGEEKACGLWVVMEGWERMVGSIMLRESSSHKKWHFETLQWFVYEDCTQCNLSCGI